jgi:hypothetical protein
VGGEGGQKLQFLNSFLKTQNGYAILCFGIIEYNALVVIKK